MDNKLIEKLRKVLALTTSPVEGEAMAAAAHLARLLAAHNLNIADLEKKGAAAPGVHEKGHDLGKAAFKWKLQLAEAIADHYFCYALVDDYRKTVKFIGRPDNVDSLIMLYGWIIDQIKRIAADERREHLANTGEHVDPLRWQVNFGLGAVERLSDRLTKESVTKESAGTALVIHHRSEISDYLEERFGYREDGRMTKKQQERQARQDAEDRRLEALKLTDIEAYYDECPWERPETPEQAAARAKADEAFWKKEARNERRRKGRYQRPMSNKEWRQMEEAESARVSGRKAGDRINLQPFVGEGQQSSKARLSR